MNNTAKSCPKPTQGKVLSANNISLRFLSGIPPPKPAGTKGAFSIFCLEKEKKKRWGEMNEVYFERNGWEMKRKHFGHRKTGGGAKGFKRGGVRR